MNIKAEEASLHVVEAQPRSASEDRSPVASECKTAFKVPFSEGALTIRELQKDDVKQVTEICFRQFRSTGWAAARYYLVVHIQDLSCLAFIAILMMPIQRFIFSVVLFLLYLFVKSRWELEHYISYECDDLRTAYETYMESGSRSRFWVADITAGNNGPSTITGCVGLVPSKEVKNVGKLVRLIVDRQHRRMKIGSRLLMQVEQYALEVGFSDMRIYTNSLNPTHVKFVRQHGYTIAHTVRRGLMRGDLITWHKCLNKTATGKPTLTRDQSEFDLTIRSAASHVMD